MAINKFDRLLLAKTEAVKGTDAVPTPNGGAGVYSNAVRCRSMDLSINSEAVADEQVKETMGESQHQIDKMSFSLAVVVAVKHAGALGVAPEIAPLLKCCGLAETIVASTSVAYDPITDPIESATIYVYKDGQLFKLLGAQGTVSFSMDAGGHIMATFTISAPYLEPTAVAVPAGAVYQATQPLIFNSASVVNEGGSPIKVGTLSLEDGNTVEEHYTTGQHEFSISNRAPKVSVSKDSPNTIAEVQALAASTAAAISAVTGSAGNRFTISAGKCTRESMGYGERGERDTRDIAWRLAETVGDDQFQLFYD